MRIKGLHSLLIAANLAVFALVVFVGAQAMGVEWRRSKPTSKTSTSEQTPSPTPSAQRSKPKMLQQFEKIARTDIFRTDQPNEPVKPRPQQTVLQETQLSLELRGTVVGQDSPSYAMIRDGRSRQEEMYRVDEYVQGVRIEGIRRDGVILQGAEGREFLRLCEPRATKPGKRPRRVRRQPRQTSHQKATK